MLTVHIIIMLQANNVQLYIVYFMYVLQQLDGDYLKPLHLINKNKHLQYIIRIIIGYNKRKYGEIFIFSVISIHFKSLIFNHHH